MQKAFSSVMEEEGLSWLGVTCAKDVATTWTAPILDLNTELNDNASNVTGWKTVKVNNIL